MSDFKMNTVEDPGSLVARVFSGSPWESKVGYCRAIRMGNVIAVSGTTSIKDGQVFAPDIPYKQAQRCLEIIEGALKELGLGRQHIFRTRMFVTDISKWEAFGKAHAEFFGEHPPATSMYQVQKLMDPALMIEIEADAFLTDGKR
jgi:isochorismate pyruvate lyase